MIYKIKNLTVAWEQTLNWPAMEAIASVVTATGIFIGAIQLRLTKKIHQTQFEDDLDDH